MDDLLPCMALNNIEDRDLILFDYFIRGFNYLEILEFLKTHHNENQSLSTLKRRLKNLGLYRRPLLNRRISDNDVRDKIQNEFYGSGSNIGYRRM